MQWTTSKYVLQMIGILRKINFISKYLYNLYLSMTITQYVSINIFIKASLIEKNYPRAVKQQMCLKKTKYMEIVS